ncbi:MAG: class I SAM-dependent methyltransferase [Syntrophorhabdales bacterium]|jgi:demethylmenaquinone methyltransferase/2-methoxy-6-polyprenyl-1,4-benzoquinol methylase
MDQGHASEIVHQFFDHTGSTYDRIARLCTFGADIWWKRRILRRIPAGPARILEQACGTGILTVKIARAYPFSEVVGVDMEEEYLDVAKRKTRLLGLRNVRFMPGRAEDVLPDGTFDCIVSSYLAKYADLAVLVANAAGMLAPGGALVMHDFTYPRNPAFLRLWLFYFTLLRTVGSRFYPEWRPAFEGLPELMRDTTWVEDLCGLMGQHAFSRITVERLTWGTAAIVAATKEEPLSIS